MLYRMKSDEKLFREWKELETEFGVRLLSSTVQNDMFMPSEQLNEDFNYLHQRYLELQQKFNESYLTKLTSLRDRTVEYIKQLNQTPITLEEFKEFRLFCPHFAGQHENGEDLFSNKEFVLTYCSHESNPVKHEGNCAMDVCPLLKGLTP